MKLNCVLTAIDSKFDEGVLSNFSDLLQYFIKSYDITDNDKELKKLTNGYPGVKVNIILSRRLLNQILAIFLPTIAIVVVCFSTNYWKVRITSQDKTDSEKALFQQKIAKSF